MGRGWWGPVSGGGLGVGWVGGGGVQGWEGRGWWGSTSGWVGVVGGLG